MRIGLDIGSTTLKCVVLDDSDNIIYKQYIRHLSQIAEKASAMLRDIAHDLGISSASLCISGSAGMGLAESLDIPFTQEVYSTRLAVKSLSPGTDTVIELGGEDAKILFLDGTMEVRMNGSCAGGTGAFIDQMATLLSISPDDMNTLAGQHTKLHSIASRCGVFAKSDIQAFLNQGATKEDISASIFYAVVNQTVAGLAQGRNIKGNILYLGGPLTFLPELRAAFDDVLKTTGRAPENSLYFVAYGAALSGEKILDIRGTADKIASYASNASYMHCPPLFESHDDYKVFHERHAKSSVPLDDKLTSSGKIWLGIDAGSTTVKFAAVNDEGGIVFSRYVPNSGNPVPIVKGFLLELYEQFPDAIVAGASSTGYGEEIIKNAFSLDCGVVETIAHFTAARAFDPDVDFIIDIGGQDIKCFKIRNGAIDNIFLNEACSSGCGSFLQSFAGALGYSPQEFAELGLFAEAPVDLGSRCTVFMNSSVKQAQKDGADINCISAGLSISVVKNALYKVIRVARPSELGQHIVVQGGTFLNDAVLRSFEQETGRKVIRPTIAGLMGYGAALYAKDFLGSDSRSGMLSYEALKEFHHEVLSINCNGCTNNCRLTINTFDGGRKFIAGNRCERPVTGKTPEKKLDLYEYKRELLASYLPVPGKRGIIGLPLVLNYYEMIPFWHAFFTRLGFEVRVSSESTRDTYYKGQHTIPSDTVCYPAKLVHGHIEELLEMGVDAIFYPCMSYNFDEDKGDNCYNCPVVAYYPEVLAANIHALESTKFIYDYIGVHRPKDFYKKMQKILAKYFPEIPMAEVKAASKAAYEERDNYLKNVRDKGSEFLREAESKKMPVIILAGRPYHLDPEVNHGIESLIIDCGAAVLCEDSVSDRVGRFPIAVLNQWTYHARMYAAAKFVAENDNHGINLIQLVSFGCGVDAITTDEVRSILEKSDRIYTQIKIDEIANLGAVKIRIRSLFAAIEQQNKRRT